MGTFLMGTSEFVVAGLLPDISSDLVIGTSEAGLLVTAFAIGMIATPVIAIATLKVSERTTLLAALAVYAAGHVVVALTDDLSVILVSRFVTALATGAFWSIAASVASRVAGPDASARAIGLVLSGGILATVIGVPLGSIAGQLVGWRGPFWILAVMALLATIPIARFVPDGSSSSTAVPLRSQLAALATGRLWVVMAACVLISCAVMSTYSFIAPLLTERSGLSSELLPVGLAIFGVGAVTGTLNSGRFAGRAPYVTALTGGVVVAIALSLLSVLSSDATISIALLAFAGMAGLGTNPVLMSMAVRFAEGAPTLATSLCTSMFNLGTAFGSWVTGQAIVGYGPVAIPVVGAVFAVILVVPLTALVVLDLGRSRRTDTTSAGQCADKDGVAIC
ncbi:MULTISPECIES: MFS transporter [unclassified Rhodococcus (in: high G+C Gram-positive bacteria)]|uniref:MFS transporter n=1 Tax=unclassified Rhodococcus (in: high G+C Gram-positive bacteria) TaxID=192944 RepID=UPI0006F7B8BC|nr:MULTISPECIES: MFS transporter [unclassified Rhodococcus (in: high G+C Gram-positive bacteria)]KQU28647.1 MFS transporter [Rhodococcus sp. Leaf225]KQU44434.1 MFS transporter [Rhodococcus sp. Leaf258]